MPTLMPEPALSRPHPHLVKDDAAHLLRHRIDGGDRAVERLVGEGVQLDGRLLAERHQRDVDLVNVDQKLELVRGRLS